MSTGYTWPSRSNLHFYRVSYASTVLAVVCLSICLSVTSKSCTKMAKPTITQKIQLNSNEITPNGGGAPNRGGVDSHQHFSTSISLYLRNGARNGHTLTFYGRLIGTHALYGMALFLMTVGDP